MDADPNTAPPLTSAQQRILRKVASSGTGADAFYASPGLGPVRVLAERKLIVGDRPTHPWSNQWSWRITRAGKEALS